MSCFFFFVFVTSTSLTDQERGRREGKYLLLCWNVRPHVCSSPFELLVQKFAICTAHERVCVRSRSQRARAFSTFEQGHFRLCSLRPFLPHLCPLSPAGPETKLLCLPNLFAGLRNFKLTSSIDLTINFYSINYKSIQS